ncbi:hypothetical protein TNCV_3786251 [Trichonephila clavipes]|nr:hypothetical protein TNCV_3786251 [Trichonephila clavipes]
MDGLLHFHNVALEPKQWPNPSLAMGVATAALMTRNLQGERGVVHMSLDHDSKLRGPSPKALVTATAGWDVVQSGRPIFDDFFQHLWPYIGNNTANVVFQMVKRLWLIHIDQ